jgi:hypothetical protein
MKWIVVHGARYAAGLSLPFLVSKSAVADWARLAGFTSVLVRDRPERWPYDARPEPYSDDWDTVVEATYTGRDTSVDAPGAPAWSMRIDFAAPHEKKKKRKPKRPRSAEPNPFPRALHPRARTTR